jgi:hypothetical protein
VVRQLLASGLSWVLGMAQGLNHSFGASNLSPTLPAQVAADGSEAVKLGLIGLRGAGDPVSTWHPAS